MYTETQKVPTSNANAQKMQNSNWSTLIHHPTTTQKIAQKHLSMRQTAWKSTLNMAKNQIPFTELTKIFWEMIIYMYYIGPLRIHSIQDLADFGDQLAGFWTSWMGIGTNWKCWMDATVKINISLFGSIRRFCDSKAHLMNLGTSWLGLEPVEWVRYEIKVLSGFNIKNN